MITRPSIRSQILCSSPSDAWRRAPKPNRRKSKIKTILFLLAMAAVGAVPGALTALAQTDQAAPTFQPLNTDASNNSSGHVGSAKKIDSIVATDGEHGTGTDKSAVIIQSQPATVDSSSSATDAEGSGSGDTGATSLGGSTGNPDRSPSNK